MNRKFTEKAEKAVKLSQESAVRMGHSYVGDRASAARFA